MSDEQIHPATDLEVRLLRMAAGQESVSIEDWMMAETRAAHERLMAAGLIGSGWEGDQPTEYATEAGLAYLREIDEATWRTGL